MRKNYTNSHPQAGVDRVVDNQAQIHFAQLVSQKIKQYMLLNSLKLNMKSLTK